MRPGEALQIGSDLIGDGEQRGGGPEDPPCYLVGGGAVYQCAVLRLLLNQRCVHFKQPGHIAVLSVLHGREAPQGITLVDGIERPLTVQGGPKVGIGGQGRLLRRSDIAFGDHG